MRVVLALLLVLGVVALAWVTFFGGGAEGPEPDGPEPYESRPRDESGTGVRETVRTESDPPARPAVPEVAIPAYPWVEPEWKTSMAKALARERVTLKLKGESLDVVLRQMSGQFGWNIDVSGIPAEFHQGNISMDLVDVDPNKVLSMLGHLMRAKVHLRPEGIQLLQEGVDPDWQGDEVFLAGLDRARTLLDAGGPKAVPAEKILPVDFEHLTLQGILLEIGSRLAVPVEFDPRIGQRARITRITLESDSMTAGQVLDDVTAAARLSWAAEERRILVTFDDRARAIRDERERARANAAKEVELAAKDRPLFQVAEEVGKQSGVPVVVDRALWEPDHPRVTLRAGPEPLGRVLRKLAAAIPARLLIRGEAIYLIPPAGR